MPQEIDGASWRADGEPDEQDQESSASGKTTSNSAALTAGRASGARVHPAGSAVRGLSWRAAQAGVPGLPHGQGGVRRLYQRDVRPVQAARHDLRPCVACDAASARSNVRKRTVSAPLRRTRYLSSSLAAWGDAGRRARAVAAVGADRRHIFDDVRAQGAGRIVRGGRPVLAPVYPVLGIRASDTLYPARGRELPPR